MTRLRLAILSTHPIQYYSPWFAHIANHADLHVYYAHRQTPEGQAAAGFSTAFDWDLPLLQGYDFTFLPNIAKRPSIQHFFGCDTPDIGQHLRDGGYDALLMFGWNKLSMLQAWLAALRAGIPVLIRTDSYLGTPRTRLTQMAKWPLYRVALPLFADFVSPGRCADTYLRHYGVPDCRIHRLPHMVDVDRFAAGAAAARKSGAAAALRERYGAAPDDTVFLMVGKMIELKRHELMFDALSCLGSDAKAVLWLVGDGPLDNMLKARIAREGLRVRRLGFVNQSDLPTYYAAADCLTLVSAHETWGLVVNEAQACGLPCIVAEEVGCAPELIEDGTTGWTLRSANPEALAQLLQRVMENGRNVHNAAIEAIARANSYTEGTRLLLQTIILVADRRRENGCGCRRNCREGD